jgi:diketogulonate reductase-like aldo/keto reductase
MEDAINAGFRWIRTAQNYAEGYCHLLVGKAIKSFNRKSLFLSEAINQNFALTKQQMIDEAKKSLERLGTDYFDLYMIGAINPEVPVSEIADGLMYLLENKITKYIGVSNYRLEELKFINGYTGGKIVCDEMHFNLVIREPVVVGVYDYCKQNGILLSAYRPLQLGQLSKPGISLVDEVAKKYGRSQSQVALRWLVQKEGVMAVVKAFDTKHIKENVEVFDFSLAPEDMDRLDKDFPIQILTSDCSGPRKPKLNA